MASVYFAIFFKLFWFFDKILISLRCKDDFGYLEPLLACFTMGGGLERFLRTSYHIFPDLPYALPLMLPYFYGSFLPFPTYYCY